MTSDRPYQTQLFDSVCAAVVAGHRRILVVLPTGGKGYMAARLMQMSVTKCCRSIYLAPE